MLNYYLNPRKHVEKDIFDDFFAPFYHNSYSAMRTDIIERENEYLLKAELPGYGKDEVKLSLDDGYLKIEATKNTEKKAEEGKYVSREIFYGSQSRSFYVGNVDQKLIKANFNNGILEVTIPKDQLPEEDKTNYIDID